MAIIFIIAGSILVESVSAETANDQATGKDLGKGDSPVLTQTVPITSTAKNGVVPMEMNEWSVNSDVWREFLGKVKYDGYSRSRLDQSGTPYDIDKIEIRGRVWKDDALQCDETDTRYDSADAIVHWEYTGWWIPGYYYARGDHAFENGPYSWYPQTSDEYYA